MLVTMKEILDKAREGNYAVAAPNIDNEHNLRVCIEVAEEMNTPIILGVPFHVNPDIPYFGRIISDLAIRSSVPIAFHLDHGGPYEQIIMAIRSGFTSVMIDRSKLPYEENVEQVKEIVKIAHAVGVTVEAELGHVGNADNYEVDGNTGLTIPEEAVRFVEETGVDALAVAIGTAHGVYKGEPNIRFELLDELRKCVPVPLVLHGGSGTGDENLRRCASSGINKVNLSNELKRSSVEELNNTDLRGPGIYGMYKYLGEGFKNRLRHDIEILGSKGKAKDW